MSVARILSRTQVGLDAPQVAVEVHIGRGLPNFTIVGLPAPVVRESRERVRAAMANSGFSFPTGRITVNLAPVELSKQGGRFDLPIALGLLIASGQVAAPSRPVECYGELGLSGELRPVNGLLLAALSASQAKHALIAPSANADEIVLSRHPMALAAATLIEAAAWLPSPRVRSSVPAISAPAISVASPAAPPAASPFLDVIGQWQARRALTIAAAGGHSLLMVGPPGSGKSMLAACLPRLLPPLPDQDAMQVAAIASVAGLKHNPLAWRQPPFRAPHHTASAAAVVGGGASARPGEISLAHRGVLFLDELPEFDRRVLESLREPLENGCITLARASGRIDLPAQFQLVAAMNPCPCGYQGDSRHTCHCSSVRVRQYRQRISGPLLDRIDIRIPVLRVAARDWVAVTTTKTDAEADVKNPVVQVRAARAQRQACSGALSARLSVRQLQDCCVLSHEGRALLRDSCEKFGLSGRGMHRLLAVSRTIADLDEKEHIACDHLAEAIQLRRYGASDTLTT
jgi:magnesium chelatase family protein